MSSSLYKKGLKTLPYVTHEGKGNIRGMEGKQETATGGL